MPSLYSQLEPELQNIIDAHKIILTNDPVFFGRGVDDAFFYLQPGVEADEIELAIDNIMDDLRFVQVGTKSGRNAAGDALYAYASRRYRELLEKESKKEPLDRSSTHHIKQEIEPAPSSPKFFSKSTGMEVSEENLIGEAMAAAFSHNNKGLK